MIECHMSQSSEARSGESLLPGLSDETPIEMLVANYGIGIDCHSRFFQLCVLVKNNDAVTKHEKTVSAGYFDLLQAKTWALELINTIEEVKSNQIKYTCQSTGPYHKPLLEAWGGRPSIVNPLLANPSRRKTDVLDAKLLAYHAITSLWPESFIITVQMQRLRDLMKFRYHAVRNATRCFNKILNTMTSYGYAVSLTGGVRLPQGRSIVEDILEGRLGGFPELCHKKLPPPVVSIVQQLYTDADMYTKRAIELTY